MKKKILLLLALSMLLSLPWTGHAQSLASLSDLSQLLENLKNQLTSLQEGRLVAAVSRSLPVYVDLKVNGSDGPVSVPIGTNMVLSWTSSGASSCFSGYQGVNPWTPSLRPTSGRDTVSLPYLAGNTTFALSCFTQSGKLVLISDTVVTTAPTVPSASIRPSLISANTYIQEEPGASNDLGQFLIRFKVAAMGGDVYLPARANVTASGVTTGYVSANVDQSGAPVTNGIPLIILTTDDSDGQTVNGNYLIRDGTERAFRLNVVVQLPAAGIGGFYRAGLGGISWGTTDAAVLSNIYTSNLESFRTPYILLD